VIGFSEIVNPVFVLFSYLSLGLPWLFNAIFLILSIIFLIWGMVHHHKLEKELKGKATSYLDVSG
jgi:hypothetical protein